MNCDSQTIVLIVFLIVIFLAYFIWDFYRITKVRKIYQNYEKFLKLARKVELEKQQHGEKIVDELEKHILNKGYGTHRFEISKRFFNKWKGKYGAEI
jgi:predicted negative regulator of RcsB-dependent stress response